MQGMQTLSPGPVSKMTFALINPSIFKSRNGNYVAFCTKLKKESSRISSELSKEEANKDRVRKTWEGDNWTLMNLPMVPSGKDPLWAVTGTQAGKFNWQDNRQTCDYGLLPTLINVLNALGTSCQNKSWFPLAFVDRWQNSTKQIMSLLHQFNRPSPVKYLRKKSSQDPHPYKLIPTARGATFSNGTGEQLSALTWSYRAYPLLLPRSHVAHIEMLCLMCQLIIQVCS